MSLSNRQKQQKLQQELTKAIITDIDDRFKEINKAISRYIEDSTTNHKNPDTVCQAIIIFYGSKLDFLTNLFNQRSTKITTIFNDSSDDELNTLYSWVQDKTAREISEYLDGCHQ